MNRQMLSGLLARNTRIIQRQADGLTPEDSLLQPPFRGNCLNWVVGHIVNSRNRMLRLLGEEPLWGEAEAQLYQRDSEAITEMVHALPFARLMGDLVSTHERLQEVINVADLDARANDDETVGEALLDLIWHETYHTGQTEQLRQLTGVGDKVI